MLDPVAAQQPAQAQRDAIRASCRFDFMAHCAGVEPGDKAALECLVRNDAKLLSSARREAVNAVAPKPAEAAQPAAPEPAAAAPDAKPGAAPAI